MAAKPTNRKSSLTRFGVKTIALRPTIRQLGEHIRVAGRRTYPPDFPRFANDMIA